MRAGRGSRANDGSSHCTSMECQNSAARTMSAALHLLPGRRCGDHRSSHSASGNMTAHREPFRGSARRQVRTRDASWWARRSERDDKLTSEQRRGTAAPPRARPHGRGARPYPRAARARAERLRARRLLAALVGALRLQALGAAPASGCRATGERVLQGPGENAGVLDLGDGLAVAFKVESHNHPSAVEPFQGAATGVGGILRDIVAMGARPIALLDGLRFGEPGPGASRAPSAASASTATASACRPSAARRSSTRRTATTAS